MDAELYDQRAKSRKEFDKIYTKSSLIDRLDSAVPIRVDGVAAKYEEIDDRWTFRSMAADINLLEIYRQQFRDVRDDYVDVEMNFDSESCYVNDNNSDNGDIQVQFCHIQQIIFQAPTDGIGVGSPEIIDSRPEEDGSIDPAEESRTTRIRLTRVETFKTGFAQMNKQRCIKYFPSNEHCSGRRRRRRSIWKATGKLIRNCATFMGHLCCYGNPL